MKTYERVLSQKEEKELRKSKKDESRWKKSYKKEIHPTRVKAAKGAKSLQARTPWSEKWFFNELKKLNFPILPTQYKADTFGLGIQNPQYEYYIPDLLNNTFKFIIEVDDKTHNTKKSYDIRRDKFFKDKGFTTFRVKYNDTNDLKSVMYKVCKHILNTRGCTPDISYLLNTWIINNYI